MRWEGQRESDNIEDRRGMTVARPGVGIGLGGIVLILAVSFLTGTNPLTLLNMLGGVQEMSMFNRAVRSACGTASSAVGPFYCPGDHKVYLDLSFFNDMAQRLGAPGDFAQAYVIAHEIGHHVQNLLGIAEQVSRRQQRISQTEGNALSVRMELQADCLAGVWGYHAQHNRNLIEPGDFEEGLRAAAAIGDDRLQKMGQGYVQPESWTHGSSEQRMTWLRRGLQFGDPGACDTFSSGRS